MYSVISKDSIFFPLIFPFPYSLKTYEISRAHSQIFLSLSAPHFHSSLFHILSPYANLFQRTACSSPSFYGLRAYTPFSCGGFTCYLKICSNLFPFPLPFSIILLPSLLFLDIGKQRQRPYLLYTMYHFYETINLRMIL